MKVTTAKELKNRTGEALRYVARGGRVPITRRGKPLAILAPATEAASREAIAVRPLPEAWAAIQAQLKATAPPSPPGRRPSGGPEGGASRPR